MTAPRPPVPRPTTPLRLAPAAAACAVALMAAACGTQPIATADAHLQQPATASAPPPEPPPARPASPPAPQAAEVRYSVAVTQQPVRDVLIAVARDTQSNIDVHPDVEGVVTLNAIDQTLAQLLERMAAQADLRYETRGDTIMVRRDTPFLSTYRVDYVNLSRETAEVMSVATQILANAPGGHASADNNSTLRIANSARHRFWETLERNLKDLLRETDKLLPEGSAETFVSGRQAGVVTVPTPRPQGGRAMPGSSRLPATAAAGATGEAMATQASSETVASRLTFREAASVIVNPEAGVVSVRATSRQHEKVAEFLEQVTGAVRRQVLIEATVVEVRLDDRYQSGVDWSALARQGVGYSIRQSLTGPSLGGSASGLTVSYADPEGPGGRSLAASLKLLNTFGRARVLSSPVLMALNNQAAVLRVTDNLVYFTVKADTNTNQSTSVTTFTTTQNVLPVGLILHVTPQVGDDDVVTLGIRPTVTARIGEVQDPNPLLRGSLTQSAIESKIPVTQTRELESVLRVASGQTAILGGLMIDTAVGARSGLPLVSRIPVLGDLFSQRDESTEKRELVIFIRPVVVRQAGVSADLAGYRPYLPGRRFFDDAGALARDKPASTQP